ncbi:nucleic-acid-binding protein from transposon X-element [Trichonephila clavipes]|nr:nucleic-acid-binding protein from transposon X-element [Trichonephila clavipes]
MADNKQLKAVIRGLPTDYDQKEIATELKGFGFDADHISILRNRKNNINMPLFLVVLKRTQENKEIFHVTNIGFFRVVVEPLKGSSMPPQCYRCQEFYHHSRLCNRAPKCLKCSGGHPPQNAKNQQSPQLNVQTAVDLIRQIFQDAPATLLTGNNTKTNPTTTSGRRKPRRAPRKPHHTNNNQKPMLRQWLKTKKKQTHLMLMQ